jgi:hypothetical protein
MRKSLLSLPSLFLPNSLPFFSHYTCIIEIAELRGGELVNRSSTEPRPDSRFFKYSLLDTEEYDFLSVALNESSTNLYAQWGNLTYGWGPNVIQSEWIGNSPPIITIARPNGNPGHFPFSFL